MYKNYIIGIFLSCLFLGFLMINQNAFAQTEQCATETIHDSKMANDPIYRAKFEDNQEKMKAHIARIVENSSNQRTEATVYTIPVVVHIVRPNDTEPQYNPSDALVNAMIQKMNDDYRAVNSGTDVEVQFVLAQRNPNCGTTNGINRILYTDATYVASGVSVPVNPPTTPGPGITDLALKNESRNQSGRWSNTDYYNIWVVHKLDGLNGDNVTPGQGYTAGYAYFASGNNADTDGTILIADQVNATSTTATHEVGHALDLYHTFRGVTQTGATTYNCPTGACATSGDEICDTEPHHVNHCGNENVCATVTDNSIKNYMSYCGGTDRFTANQITRMRAALETLRGGLISSLGGTAPSGTLPVVACTPTHSGTADNSVGITRVKLNTINVVSPGAGEGTYTDRTCLQATTVSAGSAHTITVETAFNPHNIKVYIDYNRDGDFLDTGEEIASGSSTNAFGVLTFSANYNFPSTGITFNQPLRLRVITAFVNTTPSSCAMTEGEAEDYSITVQSTATNTITLGTIPTTTYCAGSTIFVPFTFTGTFTGTNTFTAQLSDAAGNFGTPSATQIGTSSIALTIPTTATASANYKVRVIASDPVTTSNESALITINVLPLDRTITANPASITSGNTTTVEVPNSENGVSYQLQDVSNGNADVGTAVVGNGGTIQLPTQNLTANNDFRVVATNATTTCSRTLNTVTVTVTAATAPTISVTTPTTGCSGENINIAFTTTGTFAGANTFTAQVSDATGNFATPFATGTGTSSPITVAVPAASTAFANYKVRVLASSPATTSNESGTFGLNEAPLQRTVVATQSSVPTGTGTTLKIPNSEVGVSYNHDGTPTAGTGNDLFLPTGNLTSDTDFTVAAQHDNSLCPAYFNVVTITVTAAPTNTITLGTINPTYCAGATINVPFTFTGTFTGTNTFTAQLSDAAGNFGTPSATQTGTSSIALTIPTTATASANYKVRVIASDPVTTSNLSPDITINVIPNDRTITATATSVPTGTGTTIKVPNSEVGTSYALIINGTPQPTPVLVGNGGELSFNTGNLTANTNFSVGGGIVATSCTRQFNTVTVTVTAAPVCSITAISSTGLTQTTCVPATNTYTQQVRVTYSNPPTTGNLLINGQSFAITGSPQTVTLTGLTADGNAVNAVASFSDNAACTFTQNSAFTAPADCSVATGNIRNVTLNVLYGTIQAAVDAANNGDEIKILANGTYAEDVTITNKSLTFTSVATDYTQLTIKQIIFNGTGRTLTISTHMGISEVLNMQEGNIVVTVGNNFALRSTIAGTALVINDDANTVVGNVIMERYMPAVSDLSGGFDGQAYHLFSSPFVSAPISQFGDNMAAGLVLNTAYNTAPEPAFVRPFPTFFHYQETNGRANTSAYFNPFISNYKVPTTTNLEVAKGYQANIQTGTTIDLNGTLNNGTVSIAVTNSSGNTADGYNLVGNPYPSPINWDLVHAASSNLESALYLEIPTSQYDGRFAEYVAGTGVVNNGGKKEIASMQGFFVRTMAGGTVNMNNTVRLGTDTRFYKTTETQDTKEGLVRVALKGNNLLDETTVYFQNGATSNFDGKYDAAKIHKFNSKLSTLYSYNENADAPEYFAINGLGSFDADQTLPLAMNILTAGEYEITLRDMKYFHSKHQLYLYDSLTDSLHNLRAEGDYKFTATEGNEIKRFVLLFKTDGSQEFFTDEKVVVYPNPTPDEFSYSLKTAREGTYTIRLFDATGRVIFEESKTKEGAFLEGTINLEKNAAGLYLLQVSDSEKTTTVRIVKE